MEAPANSTSMVEGCSLRVRPLNESGAHHGVLLRLLGSGGKKREEDREHGAERGSGASRCEEIERRSTAARWPLLRPSPSPAERSNERCSGVGGTSGSAPVPTDPAPSTQSTLRAAMPTSTWIGIPIELWPAAPGVGLRRRGWPGAAPMQAGRRPGAGPSNHAGGRGAPPRRFRRPAPGSAPGADVWRRET